jgi:hypothetical protein
VIIRVGRTWVLLRRMLLQLLHHDLNSLVELRVVTLAECRRIEIDIVIRRYAAVFDLPFAIEAVNGGARRRDAAAVEKFRVTANAD